MKRNFCLVISAIIIFSLVLTGCDSKDITSDAIKSEKQTVEPTQTEAPAEKVTLSFFHFQSEAQEVYTELLKKFQVANPNITVEADLSGGDQYNTILKTRLASNQAADILGIHPGLSSCALYAKAGYLEDLTNEPYIKNMDEGALRVGSYDSKIYAMPTDIVYISTFYNKDIFTNLSLSTPKTWKEFLDVCEKLKQSKITPIALGNKDLWVTQLIPYAFAPTVIYSNNINFDQDMYDGKAKFNGPEWQKVLSMQSELNTKGYFQEGLLSTSYDQQLALFASGKTAMMIMGTWALKPVQDLNKDIKVGMFVTPTSDDGNNWVSGAVGGMLGINAESDNKTEAKKFFDFLMQPDNYNYYLNNTKNYPCVKGVKVNFDPAAEELSSQITNSYNFLDQNWPAGIQDPMLVGLQALFAGESAGKCLDAMDNAWLKTTATE